MPCVQPVTDAIRDKLWADVYAYRTTKGDIWFKAQEEADLAVQAYDRRATPPAEKQAAPSGEGEAS